MCRLKIWDLNNDRISKCQKGFMESEGCLEHNFVLHSLIEDARRSGRKITIAWLDLTNAFGSLPHKFILFALGKLGMGDFSIRCVADMYSGCYTKFRSNEGFTDDVSILTGVKQGCPSSPVIFNLALELMIRAITCQSSGNA